MNRFFHILKSIRFILFSKINFRDPKKKKIIVFDCDTQSYVKNFFSKKISFVLTTRSYKFKEIYISPTILSFVIRNFFKRSIKKNYLIILIKLINPKVIYTIIDNSPDFHYIYKIFEKKIKFLAIQNATREYRMMKVKDTREVYLPEYYCYSEYDKNYFLRKKIAIKKINISGSFRNSLALEYIKKKKIKINKKKFDICVIGEADKIWQKENSNQKMIDKRNVNRIMKDGDHIKKLGYSGGLIGFYAHTLSKKFNLKMVIAGKFEEGTREREYELNFYKHYLKTDDFNLIPNEPEKFSNYALVLQSRLILATDSTLLREAIGLDKKIFACNYSGHSDINFFDNKLKKFSTTINSYEVFEKKILDALKISEKDYFRYLGKNKNYIMNNSKNFHEKFQNRVFKIIK